MPRRKELAITERQFEVLTLLWEHGPMTVRELLDRLDPSGRLPYTTVLGLLQNLVRAGLAHHAVENQAHRYRAALSREEATATVLSVVVPGRMPTEPAVPTTTAPSRRPAKAAPLTLDCTQRSSTSRLPAADGDGDAACAAGHSRVRTRMAAIRAFMDASIRC